MMKRALQYGFVFFLLSCQGLLAQVQFEAKVSKTTLGINERLMVTFSMNADGDNFSPPAFEGFRIYSGPSQMVSQSWINGRRSFNKSYTYMLIPMQRGTLTIKQASVEIDGQVYKTTPVKVSVTAAVEIRDPNQPQSVGYDDLKLVAEVSKSNPYVNEPITVVYKLYLGYYAEVRNWREYEKPKYNDFWSQNIDIKNLQVEETTLNGQRTRMVVLRKTVLYPQKAGKLQIEPLSLDFDLLLPTNRRDFFGRVLMTEANKRVTTGLRTIHVKPLPEAGKPLDFDGAVGDFTFTVTPSKTELKNGESLDLTVKVSGKGNLKLFNLPKPVVPNALEMYEPAHSENVNTPLSGMNGSISDKYAIIPQYKGDYQIKPMSFSYFDLSSGRYKTITSKAITIKVLDGPEPEGEAVASSDPGKQEVTKLQQFRFIKLQTKLEPKGRKDFFGSTLFFALLAAPFLVLPFLVLARRRKAARDRDVAGNKRRQSNRLARKFLSEARKQLGNREPFYIALEKAMHNFLKAKLHIETSEMSKEKIRELLTSRHAAPQIVDAFIDLTESCEFARYAPSTTGSIQHDYDRAVQIISELEKQIQ